MSSFILARRTPLRIKKICDNYKTWINLPGSKSKSWNRTVTSLTVWRKCIIVLHLNGQWPQAPAEGGFIRV
jgi:hypothetical protein